MDWSSLLGPAISAGMALIGVVLVNRRSTVELYAKLDKQSELSDAELSRKIAVIETEIAELTREVHAHNNFAQRVPVLEEKIKVANHRISGLEKGEKHES